MTKPELPETDTERRERQERIPAPLHWRAVALVAAVVGVVHLAVATRFGWHRDEFYYVICGRHPDWGYVDQPPLAPLLARAAAALPGGMLPLRVLAIAAQVGCVLLAAVLAAEFGGRRRAQVLAAGAVAASPVFVAASLLFGTTVLDQLAWAAVLVLVARALRRGTVGAWLAAGVVAGIGLQNKSTLAVLLLGVLAGLAIYRREVLRTPGPWLAGGLAALILAPNLVWDARHQWANLHMAQVLSAQQGGVPGALAQLPLTLLLLAGPPLVVLWVAGVRRLGSAAGREHRWLLVVAVVAVVLFTAGGGKSYYVAPVLIGLFAAGAVRAEEHADNRVAWPVAMVACGLAAVLIGLPTLTPAVSSALRAVDPEPMETYGWPGYTDQVIRAAAGFPSGTPIFTSNYGEAGALTILGPGRGLHNPVYSAHNNYLLWGPPPGTPDTVLCVGQWNTAYLHRFWSDVTTVAPITLPHGLTDQETSRHAAIYLCRAPHGTWAQLWPDLRHLG
ncbi:glycosyltransferase family 39 protein [Nocardia sp. alder85J]|uniref:glycosyltransferase family 39 protein n=1 Tax=Nocardia sp. alder85J TaxID=2862949 RepID=UPI001CD22A7E|nr:glycosyltransferase family 39 protein [Nocardia sp. alder85J]MCX4091776.1 glycosyltransferase family 39 protein [Nocardia sp. alder85J]